MKILKSSYLNPFGGINFVIDELDKQGVGHILNDSLPKLKPQSRYDWRDILYSYWSIFLCGGDTAEDLSTNFKLSLSQSPFLKVPSPDRALARFKEISIPSQYFSTPRGKHQHHFAINEGLTDLNLKILNKLFDNSNQRVDLDYDNTICYTDKKDAQRTYMKEQGYVPGVGLIGSKVVYIENRNGRSNAAILQEDTLNRMFLKLKENNIRVNRFRADSASYSYKIIKTVEQHTDNFYIKARMSAGLAKVIASVEQWESINLNGSNIFRGEVLFTPFERAAQDSKEKEFLKAYRFVITKEKRRDGQVNLFTNEAYKYSVIITNDKKMSQNEIVFFYNKRGAIEKEFDVLKNDFGWKKLPFSKLEQNLVYLQITAICRNIYHYLINLFSKTYKLLQPNYRLKKFIFRFIAIPSKWIRHSRQYYLKIFGDIPIDT